MAELDKAREELERTQATLGKAQLQQDKLQAALDTAHSEIDKLQEKLDKSAVENRKVKLGGLFMIRKNIYQKDVPNCELQCYFVKPNS